MVSTHYGILSYKWFKFKHIFFSSVLFFFWDISSPLLNTTCRVLRNNDLTGTIPSSIGELQQLKHLWVNVKDLKTTLLAQLTFHVHSWSCTFCFQRFELQQVNWTNSRLSFQHQLTLFSVIHLLSSVLYQQISSIVCFLIATIKY